MEKYLQFPIRTVESVSVKKRKRMVTVSYTDPFGKKLIVTRHISGTTGSGLGSHPAPEAERERALARLVRSQAEANVSSLAQRVQELEEVADVADLKAKLTTAKEHLVQAHESLNLALAGEKHILATYPPMVEYVEHTESELGVVETEAVEA